MSIRIYVKLAVFYSLLRVVTILYKLMTLYLYYTLCCIFAYVNQIYVTLTSSLTAADIKMEHGYWYCNAQTESNSINDKMCSLSLCKTSDTYTMYLSSIWMASSFQIVEDPIMTVKCRRTIKALFIYINLYLSVMWDSLSCSFTPISFLTKCVSWLILLWTYTDCISTNSY